MILEVIILTKSEKLNNYCVAGIRTDDRSWIRLENERVRGNAMTLDDITYADGSVMEELDVITVDCEVAPAEYDYEYLPIWGNEEDTQTLTINYQPENYLVNTDIPLEKVRTATLDEVLSLHPVEVKNSILATKYECQSYDFVTNELSVKKSLQLVKVSNMCIHACAGEARHPKVEFDYENKNHDTIHYSITVTDPAYRNHNNEENYDEGIIVVSLGMPFNRSRDDRLKCYLLAAKIYVNDQDPEQNQEN